MRFGLVFPALLCVSGCAAGSAEPGPRNIEISLGMAPRNEEASALERAPDRAARTHTGNPWIDCYLGFEPSDDPAADLSRLSEACGSAGGLQPISSVRIGDAQSESDPPERLVFQVRSGRCYRAFSVAEPGVDDLDIAFYDEEGELLAGDGSRDRWPVVPPRGLLCARTSEALSISIAVVKGSGHHLLQIWGTAENKNEETARWER